MSTNAAVLQTEYRISGVALGARELRIDVRKLISTGYPAGAQFSQYLGTLKSRLRKKTGGAAPRSLKMEALLSEFLRRQLVGRPAFANFRESQMGRAGQLAG